MGGASKMMGSRVKHAKSNLKLLHNLNFRFTKEIKLNSDINKHKFISVENW